MFSPTGIPAEMEDGTNDNDDTFEQESEKQSATTPKTPSKWEETKKLLGKAMSLKRKAKEDRIPEYYFGQDLAKSLSELDARQAAMAKIRSQQVL
ncbi:hypothetical protein PoB_006491900 [Plakobranchus ocellatus]|uniref:RRP15-like protein n=1 Tax=Plakobranchus ocellatus TaxID=259542 RepID=A0AAV4D2M3_9GAST|nr:hypothetical protein PoB_006491900 [Plakobranchus ocellatus]